MRRPPPPRAGVAQGVIPTDAADVRGEGAARIRRMSANEHCVASGQKRRRSGKLAQVGRASTAYVTSRRKDLRDQIPSIRIKQKVSHAQG
jgi:hypothetical protein